MKSIQIGNGQILYVSRVRQIKITGCKWIEYINRAIEEGVVNWHKTEEDGRH